MFRAAIPADGQNKEFFVSEVQGSDSNAQVDSLFNCKQYWHKLSKLEHVSCYDLKNAFQLQVIC